MSVSVQEQAILLSMKPLFAEAEGKGLWFFHESIEAGEVWCSPAYLQHKQSKGEMIWAPEHWELRSPRVYLKKLAMQAEATVKEFNDMAARLNEPKRLRLASLISNEAADGSASSA